MARSSSVISVAIIGDASKLVGAVGVAEQSTGSLIKKTAVAVGGTIAVAKGFDLLGEAMSEGDRLGDVVARLSNQIGKIPTKKLESTADNFSDIGASAQDMLELEAIYADIATSAGVAEPEIVANAEALAATALAVAQVHDADPTTIIEAMTKAIGGSTRGLKEYGVDLTEAAVQQAAMEMTGKDNADALTDQELAAARTKLILDEFAPILKDVTEGTGDAAQKQDELRAKFETVAGKIGEGLQGPVGGLLDWVNDMVDAIPGAIEGWQLLGAAIENMVKEILTPLARAKDAVDALLDGLADLRGGNVGHDPIGDFIFGTGDRNTANAGRREGERNGTPLGDP